MLYKFIVLFFLAFGFSNTSFSQNRCLTDRSGFVRSCNGNLYLDGEEYREIGFNFYTAFRLYLDLGWDYQEGQGRDFARANLKAIADHGHKVIRVMGPYSRGEFHEIFFKKDNIGISYNRIDYLAALDKFLDDCEIYGIKVVFSLAWHLPAFAELGRQPMRDLLIYPESRGREKLRDYITTIVGHSRGRKSILAWEICNEGNLSADLPQIGFSSDELAGFYGEIIKLIKSIDKDHLVVTGNAEPRPQASHLYRSFKKSKKPDHTSDTSREHAAMMLLLEKEADLLSSHYYMNDGAVLSDVGLQFYKNLAVKLGKPLFIGEAGPHFKTVAGGDWTKFTNTDYREIGVLEDIRHKSAEVVRVAPAITLWWAYDCRDGDSVAFRLCYGKTDEALSIIEQSNKQIKKRQE